MRDPAEEFHRRVRAMTDAAWTSRTRALIGDDAAEHMRRSHVLVMGLGGVGSYCAEFLVRAGIGRLTVCDGDVIDPSNRNRQLPALATTEGMYKADVMRERLHAINPELRLITVKEFMTPTRIVSILATKFDYVVDAIDSLSPKVHLIAEAVKREYRIVSSMGAGGKLDPTLVRIADIAQTQKCNLARYVRKRLRYRGISTGVTAVYSLEEVDDDALMYTDGTNFKKSAFGTISYLPAAFGGACASVVIRGLISDVVVADAP